MYTTASSGSIRRRLAAAIVTAGLKCPPLAAPKVMISPNRTNAWTRPTTAKSEPCAASGVVATKSVTTTPTVNTRKNVPRSSAM